MRLVIVTGLSGSGKSVALNMLEDLGYFCIDNIPVQLLRDFIRNTVFSQDPTYERTAVGLDARSPSTDIASVPPLIEEVTRAGASCETIFLDADDETIIKRYSETRRRHPLSDEHTSLAEAITRERALLEPIAMVSDLVIDTTRKSVHGLREAIRERVHGRPVGALSIQVESFGFKHGVPKDADFVFDVRCLPNPHWDLTLRSQTGRDEAVIAYLEQHDSVSRMVEQIIGFLDTWIPEFMRTNRAYLTVAIGCTGGRHRSVYVADRLAQHFRRRYPAVLIHHAALQAT